MTPLLLLDYATTHGGTIFYEVQGRIFSPLFQIVFHSSHSLNDR